MSITELIAKKVKGLPETNQRQVLGYVETLLKKAQASSGFEEEKTQWSRFSLKQSMKGMDLEKEVEYSLEDLPKKAS